MVSFRARAGQVTKDTLSLAELNPDLALAKSFWGGDCSSTECLAYPYSRFERVFVILDAAGAGRGYLALSQVLAGQTTAVYLNTINGRRVGTAQTLMIVEGLRRVLPALRVRELVLPLAKRIDENINFHAIGEPLQGLIEGLPEAELKFYDPAERARLEGFSRLPYDAIENNSRGVIVPAARLNTLNLRVKVSAGSRYAALDLHPPAAAELIAAALDLVSSGRADVARALWALAGRPAAEVDGLSAAVTNTRGDNLDDYHHNVADLLAQMGLAEVREFTRLHPYHFELGEVLAADSLAAPNRARTFARLLSRVVQQQEPQNIPAVAAWLKRLDGATRDQLIVLTTQRLYAAKHLPSEGFAHEEPEYFLGRFVTHLLDFETLRARAGEFHRMGAAWPELVAMALDLAMRATPPTNISGTAAMQAIAQIAFADTRTPAEFTTRAAELFAGKGEGDESAIFQAFAHSVSHYLSLGPTAADHARLGRSWGQEELFATLMAWLTGPPGGLRRNVLGHFTRDAPGAPGLDPLFGPGRNQTQRLYGAGSGRGAN